MKCGLLGEKLGHSYSPQIHGYLGSYSYTLFEKKPEELQDFLRHGDFTGLNVTIPYKKAVLEFCDQLSSRAIALGAVNTIVRNQDGSLTGHNTDYFGFSYMVRRTGLTVQGKKTLVLGSGGASATAVAVLQELGAQVVVISRTGNDNYDNITKHADASLIVNATPVGMYPNVEESPVDIGSFTQLEGVVDMIYNPARTQLLMDAQARGIVAENGLWMLVAQAKESAEWFTGKQISDDVIPHIYQKMQSRMENTVLIGMPGCGKSTIGKLLAQALNKTFVDADAQIEQTAGKPIPQIFAESGEAGFRRIETQVLCSLGKQSALVIATGGGCVTREENYPHLHRNGKIIWIQRPTEQLPTDGRPLSQAGSLQEMYLIRKPMYERFADMTVKNCGSAEDAVANILETGGI